MQAARAKTKERTKAAGSTSSKDEVISCAGAEDGSSDEDRVNSLRGKRYHYRKAKREAHDVEKQSRAASSSYMVRLETLLPCELQVCIYTLVEKRTLIWVLGEGRPRCFECAEPVWDSTKVSSQPQRQPQAQQ
jgi:hypothetical protein